jgi:ribonuclease-3|tara:strand:+ start:157 stop:825 length:669 start_codon:yes stop_codon:yes gene_type:complete
MKKNFNQFEKKIGYNFNNINLLIQSLTHKSFDPIKNNEKLEFLGDRVLGLIISKNLLKTFPNDNEGDLDKKLASLVNRKQCVKIANKLNLSEFILIRNSKNKKQEIENKILSDSIESIIGAIYLDQGFEKVEKFILDHWREDIIKRTITERDAKTKLQELSLKVDKSLPIYKLIENKGPRHKPIIKVSVKIKNSKVIVAIGNSKKEAEQNAAKKLLDIIKSK